MEPTKPKRVGGGLVLLRKPYGTVWTVTCELTTAELKSGEAATDERVGVLTPDKNGHTADGAGRVPVD